MLFSYTINKRQSAPPVVSGRSKVCKRVVSVKQAWSRGRTSARGCERAAGMVEERVTQTGSLLFRRLAVGRHSIGVAMCSGSSGCGLPIRDTADCQSALPRCRRWHAGSGQQQGGTGEDFQCVRDVSFEFAFGGDRWPAFIGGAAAAGFDEGAHLA